MNKPSPADASGRDTNDVPCKVAFPGFTLDFTLPPGFVDSSWHHNETPSFDKQQPDGTVLRLWVDYPDRALSRLSEEEPYFRFSLARYTAEEDWLAQLAFANTPQEALELVALYDGV